jgi:hypothetical protein
MEDADSSWERCALPLLREIRKIEVTPEASGVGTDDLARRIDCSGAETFVELQRLIAGRYVGGTLTRTTGSGGIITRVQLLEKGAQAIREWPSKDPYELLLHLLDERIDAAGTDIETKTKLAKMRGALVDVGKGTASALLATALKQALGQL